MPPVKDPARTAMWAAAAVATAGTLPVFLTGAMAVQMRADIGFDESGLGVTVAAFFGTAAALSAIGGRVAERLGPAGGTRAAATGSAGALLLIGAGARSVPLLLASLVVGGAANALAQPATNLLIAQRVAPHRLGMAFGIKQSAIPIATLLGGLAVPTVALTVGWRWAFVGAAVLALVLAWRDPGGDDDATVRRRGARRTADDTGVRALALLGLGAALGAAAAGTIGSFLVSASVDAGIDEGAAGVLAFVCSAAGITTRMIAGARADVRGGGHLRVVAVMLGIGSLTYVALATRTPALMVVGGLTAYCFAWGWPGLFNLAVVRSNPGAPGAATGITQTGTYIGAVLGPLVFGFTVDAWGYGWSFLGSAAVSALAALAIANARRALKRDQARRAALAGM
jgi:MFS family permease